MQKTPLVTNSLEKMCPHKDSTCYKECVAAGKLCGYVIAGTPCKHPQPYRNGAPATMRVDAIPPRRNNGQPIGH